MKLTRHKLGRGFTYLDQDGERLNRASSQGREVLVWIDSLAIPPAWQGVRIDTDAATKIYASGRDAGGKKQYIYNPEWRALRNQEKFERVLRFANQLSDMRSVTRKHLKSFFTNQEATRRALTRDVVLSCMVRLIDSAYFRPGNSQYSADNDSYGITTLRSRHLSVDDNELNFEYQGKSGVEQSKTVVDDRLARIVSELDDQPGYRIFKYFDGAEKRYVNSDDLNAYIRELMGEEFSAKDFRTWAATMITAAALAQSPSGGSEKDRRKIVIEALGVAAERLGNTPKICEENYVDPRVIEAYMSGLTIADFNYTSDIPLDGNMSKDELATIDLLESYS